MGRDDHAAFMGWEEDPTTRRDRLRDVDFNVPEQAWVTWGGEVTLIGGNPNVDEPWKEVARIECPSPRALAGTIAIHGDPIGGQVIDLRLFQGVGRVDLRRQWLAFIPTTLDLFLPARMLRLETRINAQSPPGTDVIVQAVFGPDQTWLDERLSERRRHKV